MKAVSNFLIILVAICVGDVSNVFSQAPDGPPSAQTDALYFDALKARAQGDDVTTEKLLLQFAKARPENSAVWYELARVSIKSAKPGKAEEQIKKAINLEPSNKWYRERLARVLLAQSKFEDAAKEYATLAKSEKYNEDYLLDAAQSYASGKRYKEALEQLDILSAKPGSPEEVLRLKQTVYLKMNDVKGATRVARELIDRQPKDVKNYVMLAELYNNNKQPEEAKRLYEDIGVKFTDNPDAQFALAEYYRLSGDTAKYATYLRKAIVNPSLDATGQIGLLRAYVSAAPNDTARIAEAVKLTGRITELHPADVGVRLFYGDILSVSGQRPEAFQQYRAAVDIDPSAFAVWDKLLRNLTDPSDADSLIRYSEKAAKLFPNIAMVQYYNALGRNGKKDYNGAVRALRRAIDLQPEDGTELLSDMLSTLGDIYNSAEKWASSDSAYEAALKANGRNATALNNYAYYLSLRNKRLDDAERMSKLSLQIRPGEATFLDTYGWILFQQGEYKKAKDYLQQAAAASPSDGAVLEHLGDVYSKLGESARAAEFWRKARDAGGDPAGLDKKLAETKAK